MFFLSKQNIRFGLSSQSFLINGSRKKLKVDIIRIRDKNTKKFQAPPAKIWRVSAQTDFP